MGWYVAGTTGGRRISVGFVVVVVDDATGVVDVVVT